MLDSHEKSTSSFMVTNSQKVYRLQKKFTKGLVDRLLVIWFGSWTQFTDYMKISTPKNLPDSEKSMDTEAVPRGTTSLANSVIDMEVAPKCM